MKTNFDFIKENSYNYEYNDNEYKYNDVFDRLDFRIAKDVVGLISFSLFYINILFELNFDPILFF